MTEINKHLQVGHFIKFVTERFFASQRPYRGIGNQVLLDFGETHFGCLLAGNRRTIFVQTFDTTFGRGVF
jgi:hypothetical protein